MNDHQLYCEAFMDGVLFILSLRNCHTEMSDRLMDRYTKHRENAAVVLEFPDPAKADGGEHG